MTTQPNQDDVAAFMEELDKQLAKVIVGAMERGNMYDGYVVSAEFNVEAAKVVDTYLPMLKDILQQSNRQLLDEVEREVVGSDQEPGGYHGGDLNEPDDAKRITNNVRNSLRGQQRATLRAIKERRGL